MITNKTFPSFLETFAIIVFFNHLIIFMIIDSDVYDVIIKLPYPLHERDTENLKNTCTHRPQTHAHTQVYTQKNNVY